MSGSILACTAANVNKRHKTNVGVNEQGTTRPFEVRNLFYNCLKSIIEGAFVVAYSEWFSLNALHRTLSLIIY